MSQNRAARISDRRSQLDLQLNLLSEQENTKMIEMLERIGETVGADFGSRKTLQALEAAIKPEALIEEVDRAAELKEKPRTDSKKPGK